MRYLSVEEVFLIHEYQIQEFGGADGLLNLPLLESAIYRPRTIFGNEEKYKTIFEKVAILAYSIMKNHPFVDGNKRTSMVAAIIFLELNGYKISCTQEELVKLAVDIASDKISIEDIAEFYRDKAD